MKHRIVLIASDAFIFSFWALVAGVFFIAANAHSPISLSRRSELSVLSISPEGWGFFTRDPQEPRLLLFARTSSGVLADTNPATVRSWYEVLGGSRGSRIRGMEIAKLQALVPLHAWRPCRSDLRECVADESVRISNPMRVKTVCGEHVLQVQVPVPWAWSARRADVHMKSKVARISVDCGGNAT